MYITRSTGITLVLLFSFVFYKILKCIVLYMSKRSLLRNLPGFQGNGHWFSGHTSDIKKIGKLNLLKKYPSFFKFSEGFLSYRISCHDPNFVRLVMQNSDKSTDRISSDWLAFRGDTAVEKIPMGPQLKAYKSIFQKCYGVHHKHFIKICREVFRSSLDELKIVNQKKYKIMNMRSLLSGIEFELPIRLWLGKTNNGFEKILRDLYDFEEGSHCKADFGSPFEYCKKMYETLNVYRRRRRIRQLHSKVLATHRKLISKSINRETGHHSILDRLIILEMNGHHNLSDNHYASMLVAHLTLVKAFRRMFIWLIKSLAENITWQDKIRDELIKMKRQDLYSDDNLQLEYFRDLNMFLCETMRMYPSELVTRKVTRSFKFKEHEIPMGTLIDVDLKCLHLNPLFWEFPDKFMPERFLDGTGKYLYQFLPFSTGPRMCPAKTLMVTIMKTFLITFIESVKIETANTNHNEVHILQDIKVTTIKEV